MEDGYYVVRMPSRGAGSRLTIESRPFRERPEYPGDAKLRAASWADFIQSEHPKDKVYVIKINNEFHVD